MENVQTETIIKLEVNVNDYNLIVAALRELPHRVSDELIKNVVSQAQKQVPQR